MAESYRGRQARVIDRVLAAGEPTSQRAACRLGVRVSLDMGGIPRSEDEIKSCARAGARGLFGPAFDAATKSQRAVWCALYEDELRAEMRLRSPLND